MEILSPQELHFALRNKKLSMGIFSHHFSLWPHFGQAEPGLTTDLP